MCPNPTSEKPGTANSSVNIKTLHSIDVFHGDNFIVTASYKFGGSRTIGYESYENALKVFYYWISNAYKQGISKVKLERISLSEPIKVERKRMKPEDFKIDTAFLKVWENKQFNQADRKR